MTADDDDDGCGCFNDGGQEQRQRRRQRHEAVEAVRAIIEHKDSGDLQLYSGAAAAADLTCGTTHHYRQKYLSAENKPTTTTFTTSSHPHLSTLIRSSSASSSSSSSFSGSHPELCNRSCSFADAASSSSSSSSYHRHHLQHPSHPTTSERLPPLTLTAENQPPLRKSAIMHQQRQQGRQQQQSSPTSPKLFPHYHLGEEDELKKKKSDGQQQQRHTSAAAAVAATANHQSKQQVPEQKRLKTTAAEAAQARQQQSTAVDAAGGTYLAHNRLPFPPHGQFMEDQRRCRPDQFVVNFGKEQQQQQQTKWPENGLQKKESCSKECCSSSTTTVAKIALQQALVADDMQQQQQQRQQEGHGGYKAKSGSTATTNPTTSGHFATATGAVDTPLKLAAGGSGGGGNRSCFSGSNREYQSALNHEDLQCTAASAASAAVYKPCTTQRPSQLTSDTGKKRPTTTKTVDDNAPRTPLSEKNICFLNAADSHSLNGYCYPNCNQYSKSLCLDSLSVGDSFPLFHHRSQSTTSAKPRAEYSSSSSSTGRPSEPLSKTANPDVLRAKLFSARFAAESAASSGSGNSRESYLRQEEEEDKNESATSSSASSSAASDEEAEASESLLPAQTASIQRSSSGHAISFTSSAPAISHQQKPPAITNSNHSSHSSSSSSSLSNSGSLRNSGLVNWTELRDKLTRLQRKAAFSRRRKSYINKAQSCNKRVTPSSSSISKISAPTSALTSRASSTALSSSSVSGKQRQLINRNLLAEFRRRFRPASAGGGDSNRSNRSSLLYFDNPVSATNNKAVNYSYSYYNFFYYPPKQQQQQEEAEQESLSTVVTIDDHQQVKSPLALTAAPRYSCETERNLQRNLHFHPHQQVSSGSASFLRPNHNYHHLHHPHPHLAATTSLTSLLSTTSSTTSSSSCSPPHPTTSSPLEPSCCNQHHFCHCNLDPAGTGISPTERNLLLPHSASAEPVLGGVCEDSAEEEASSSSNGCLSTIMEVLPLVLLLTMGVIISTTCAKFTFHSSSSPATSGAASSAAAYHHRFSGLSPQSPPGVYQESSSGGQFHHLNQETRSLSDRRSGDSRPEPPYLTMMQNDDEYSGASRSSETAGASSDSSVESYNSSGEGVGSKAVDEYMKKSSASGHQSYNYNHQHQQKQIFGDQQAAPNGSNNNSSSNQQSMLAQLAHQYAAMQLKWVANASAACNDGTRAGYYIRRHSSSRRWLIYLEGGWYCMSKTTCEHRWAKMRELMTSFRWTQFKTFNGILSASPTVNPYMWDANHVFIPYCSSDIWSGSATGARDEMSFLGSRIIDEVIRTLLNTPSYHFADAKFVLLAGSSAGAAGVMINLDRVAQQIADAGSKADVRGLADSGWVLESDFIEKMINKGGGGGRGDGGDHFSSNNKGYSNSNKSPHHQGRTSKVPPPALQPPPCTDAEKCSPGDSIQGAYKLWNSRVPEACMERYRDEPWRCFYGYRLYPTLKTPLFVVQFQYDEFQIHVDGIANGAKWGELEKVQYFRLISQALRETLSPLKAVFAPACMSHIILTRPDWHKVAVKSVTLPDALRCWEETPMAVVPTTQQYIGGGTTRYTPDALTFLQQHFPSLYQTYKNSLVNNKVAPSAKIAFNAMYPYGMPVVTTSEGGNGPLQSSGEQIELPEQSSTEDELSQYYSNGNRQMTFNYGTQGAAGGSASSGGSSNIPVKSAASGNGGSTNNNNNNNHYYSNLQEEMMAGDDPRAAAAQLASSSSSAEQIKSTASVAAVDDENGNNIVVISSSNSISSTTSRPHGHRSSYSSSTSTSSHHGHSHSSHGNGSQSTKQEKKRRKRKRRKHLQRRSTTTTTTTTSSPLMMMYSSTISYYKPRRQMVVSNGGGGGHQQVEDNNIKVNHHQNLQYQNDGTSHYPSSSSSPHHHHHHSQQSRSKKHNRPSRMFSQFDFVQQQPSGNGGDQWSSMSGGDDAVTDTFYGASNGKQCQFRLIDGDMFVKNNGFSCPSTIGRDL